MSSSLSDCGASCVSSSTSVVSSTVDRIIERSQRFREVQLAQHKRASPKHYSLDVDNENNDDESLDDEHNENEESEQSQSPDKYVPLNETGKEHGVLLAEVMTKFNLQHSNFSKVVEQQQNTMMRQRLRNAIMTSTPEGNTSNVNCQIPTNTLADHVDYSHTLSTASLTLDASILEFLEEDEETEDESTVSTNTTSLPDGQEHKYEHQHQHDHQQHGIEDEEDVFSNLPATPQSSTKSVPRIRNAHSYNINSATTINTPTRNTPTRNGSTMNTPTHTVATSLTRLTRQVAVNNRGPVAPPRTTNRVQVHVYDLIHRETVLETPWCDFPIGKCFNTFNDGMHCLGTGAYHVGIEVNGIEYAFGSNQLEGQSGVFICPPKKSPGYQYRTTLDIGQIETSRRQWILVPVLLPSNNSNNNSKSHYTNTNNSDETTATTTISADLNSPKRKHYYDHDNNTNCNTSNRHQILNIIPDGDFDDTPSLRAMSETYASPTQHGRYIGVEQRWNSRMSSAHHHDVVSTPGGAALISPPTTAPQEVTYQYREIKSFFDGKVILKEMSQEYMGVDYDILRKNCCTFVKDACLRLGAEEHKIPTWFLNLAETGVMTEDAVNTVDGYVFSPIRRILSEQCADEEKVKLLLANKLKEQEQDVVAPGGYEIIALSAAGDHYTNIFHVEDITQYNNSSSPSSTSAANMGIRTTISWAY